MSWRVPLAVVTLALGSGRGWIPAQGGNDALKYTKPLPGLFS